MLPAGLRDGGAEGAGVGIINELESTGREIYTGAIGFVSPLWGLEFNVAIRTFEIAGGSVWLGAGGGVVADSDPHAEYLECLAKAEPLIRAVSTGGYQGLHRPGPADAGGAYGARS